jgi:hypothetical protein
MVELAAQLAAPEKLGAPEEVAAMWATIESLPPVMADDAGKT